MDVTNITIVTVTDNRFIVLLGALLKSIAINHKSPERIDFYVVEEKVSIKNKIRLEQCVHGSSISLHWLPINSVLPDKKNLPLDNSPFPVNVYTRLFIPSFLSIDVGKVIYLDVDMIVLADIADLWNTDLKGFAVSAVADRCGTLGSWAGIKNFKELGLDSDAKYLNSGLLLIDAKKWRENNITFEVLACIRKNRKFASYPDQYGLNVVLAKRWYELDSSWNSYSTNDSDPDARIIHFIGRKPIYKNYNLNENYRRLFFQYLAMTPWADFKLITPIEYKLRKIYNILLKRTLLFMQ